MAFKKDGSHPSFLLPRIPGWSLPTFCPLGPALFPLPLSLLQVLSLPQINPIRPISVAWHDF